MDMGWMVQQSRIVNLLALGQSDAVRDTCEVRWAGRDWGLVHAVLAGRVCNMEEEPLAQHQFYLLSLSG
jgi:hypothetical protein